MHLLYIFTRSRQEYKLITHYNALDRTPLLLYSSAKIYLIVNLPHLDTHQGRFYLFHAVTRCGGATANSDYHCVHTPLWQWRSWTPPFHHCQLHCVLVLSLDWALLHHPSHFCCNQCKLLDSLCPDNGSTKHKASLLVYRCYLLIYLQCEAVCHFMIHIDMLFPSKGPEC